MKNKLVKTLSLGIAGLMFSVLLVAHTPQNNVVSLTPNPTNRIIIVPCQDPPF